ncbi:phage tail tape measure protein [Kiloniella sp. b19]|uniref:phage tail tape measure protein n=1 Tax=Kiloniella sp. GXU_MW_B19 TaxID=3141326 RepID=UPI0031D380F0
MKPLTLQLNLNLKENFAKGLNLFNSGTEKLQDNLVKTRSQLRTLEQAGKRLDEFDRLTERLNQNSDALQKAQEKAQKLSRQMANGEKTVQQTATAMKKAREEVKRLKEQKVALTQKSQGITAELKKQNLSTSTLEMSKRKLTQRIKKESDALKQHNRQLDENRKRTERLAKARERMDKSLALQSNVSFVGAAGFMAGRGLLNGGLSVLEPGIGFEEQMSKVGALARIDKSSEAFARLQAQAKELGATTQFSAGEAAQGMGFLAMAGFEVNEIMQTMPSMLDLAKAGAMDLARTADIASNILSGFGLEATEMGRVSDVLAATFTRSNVDLEMLGNTMTYVAPIAREIGVSIEEASAMAGLLGNVGIQGEKAGTALRSIQNRLAAPPKMAADAIAELGITTQDAQGNLLPMIDILGQVAKATEDMGNAERLGHFKHIAGAEAGAAFAELVNQGGTAAIYDFIDVLRSAGGESRRISKEMGDNAAGDIKAFASAWEGMNIAIFETNNGPLRSIVQKGTELVRTFTAWIDENPKLASALTATFAVLAVGITVAGGLALTIAGIFGPLAMVRFGMAQFALSAGGVTKGITLISSAWKWLNVVMMANPIVAAITLAVIAIAGLGYLIWDNWDRISAFFQKIGWLIDAVFAGKWEAAAIHIKSILGDLGDYILFWIDLAIAPFKLLGKAFIAVFDGISSLFEDNTIGVEHTALEGPARKIETVPAKQVAQDTFRSLRGGGVTDNSQTENIWNIHGGDPKEVEQAVANAMEQERLKKQRQQRGALYDYDTAYGGL